MLNFDSITFFQDNDKKGIGKCQQNIYQSADDST